MNAIHAEMRYVRRRIRETLAMADAAAGPCSRTAHETLARLYGETLAALSASLRGERRAMFAPHDVPVAARALPPATPVPRMTVMLAQ